MSRLALRSLQKPRCMTSGYTSKTKGGKLCHREAVYSVKCRLEHTEALC